MSSPNEMDAILDEVFFATHRQFPDIAVCNIATRRVLRRAGDISAVEDLAGLANQQARQLARNEGWVEVPSHLAGGLAAEGVWVVGTWSNPAGHGHTTVVRPRTAPVPWLMTCGVPETAARSPWAHSDAVHRSCGTAPRFYARRRG
jgi:hypothetical protein